MIAQHSSASVEHYTPFFIVEAARRLMGRIDLDPASCALANETVKAARYYTRDDDGLTKPWKGKIFLNPPGGLIKAPGQKAQSSTRIWWRKLTDEYRTARIEQAVVVGFSLECLQSLQNEWFCVQEFPFCVPSKRLRFLAPTGNGGTCVGGAPTHANVIVWWPPEPIGSRASRVSRADEMREAFWGIGAVT